MSAYNPFHDFDELERSFFNDNAIGEFKTDIKDNGKEFVLEADLPGFKKEDIHVDLDENTLTISAERHSDYEEKDKKGNFVRCERSYGSYARSFDTTGIDTANMKAAYEDGVLKLTMPKLSEPQNNSRRLMIE
jgi:HSP20 family protein